MFSDWANALAKGVFFSFVAVGDIGLDTTAKLILLTLVLFSLTSAECNNVLSADTKVTLS